MADRVAENQVVLVGHTLDIVECLTTGDVTTVVVLKFALEVLTTGQVRSALILSLAVAVTAFVVGGTESIHDGAAVVT